MTKKSIPDFETIRDQLVGGASTAVETLRDQLAGASTAVATLRDQLAGVSTAVANFVPPRTIDAIKNVIPQPETPPAERTYGRIARQINEFEKNLTSQEEIGGRFLSTPKEEVFHIEDLDYRNPDMLVFHGKDGNGRPVQLLQHYSQLSVLLSVVPTQEQQPRRIGFVLLERLGEKKSQEPEG